MSRATDAAASITASRPTWLREAPTDLRPLLDIGFEKYGDDPAAIARWIGKVHDYKKFWNLVEAQGYSLEERYAHDEALQAQIAEARSHPERRVPRTARSTA